MFQFLRLATTVLVFLRLTVIPIETLYHIIWKRLLPWFTRRLLQKDSELTVGHCLFHIGFTSVKVI